MREWYLTDTGAPIVWATAVVDGRAAVEIHRVEQAAPGGALRRTLWRAVGDRVTTQAQAAAVAAQTPDPLPTPAQPGLTDLRTVKATQATYDALPAKDDRTLYAIVEGS